MGIFFFFLCSKRRKMNIRPRFLSLNTFWAEEEEKEETLGLCEMFI